MFQRPPRPESVVMIAQRDGGPLDGSVGSGMGKEGVTVLLAEVFSWLR